jgi:hypothetical protein
MDRIDYSKLDPWIKKHPEAKYAEFVVANPKFNSSIWSYTKRRAKLLGLPMTPSMKRGYRSNKSEGEVLDRRSRSIYNTIYSISVPDLKKKNGIVAASEIISAMNRIFKLHLESAQVEVLGTGIQNYEIRRYGR